MENSKVTILNEVKLILFSVVIGAVCGLIFWFFLLVLNSLTELIWDILPSKIGNLPYYGAIVCTIGGLLIGVLRKKFGDYPQEMEIVFGILKQTGTYDY